MVRWLLDTKQVPLSVVDKHCQLKTAEGVTPLGMAAFYGHKDIMRYLVVFHHRDQRYRRVAESFARSA